VRARHPGREERERRFRRALVAGMLVSLVVHFVIVVVLSAKLAIPPRGYRPVEGPPRTRMPEGLRALNLRVRTTPPEAGTEPRRPAPPRTERQAAAAERPGPTREQPAETEGEKLTNAEKIQPRPGDIRVWEGISPEDVPERELTGIQRADSAVYAILRDYLDSVRLGNEAEKRAREWLVGEGDEKWGIASDGLHLGDIVIPIPFGQLFQATGEKGRKLRQELQDLEVIQYQDALDRARETREKRVKEMRKKSQEKSGESPPDTGGSQSPPDTSGGPGGLVDAGAGREDVGLAAAGVPPDVEAVASGAALDAFAGVARPGERPLDSPTGAGGGRLALRTSPAEPFDRKHPSPPRGPGHT